jgi:hypothetical protein
MSDKIVLKDSTLATSNEAKQLFTLGSAGVFAFDAAKSFDNYLNANEIGLTPEQVGTAYQAVTDWAAGASHAFGEVSLDALKADASLTQTEVKAQLVKGVDYSATFRKEVMVSNGNMENPERVPAYGRLNAEIVVNACANKGEYGKVRRSLAAAAKEAFGS